MFLPRLTATLRLNPNLSRPPVKSVLSSREELEAKIRERAKKIARENTLTWTDLKAKLSKDVNSNSTSSLTVRFNEFKATVRRIVGDDCPFETVESAAVFIFKLLHNCDKIEMKHISELRMTFGCSDVDLIREAQEIVNQIVHIVSEETIERLFETNSNAKSNDTTPMFGHNIKFVQPSPIEMKIEFFDLEDSEDGEKPLFIIDYESKSSNSSSSNEPKTAVVKYDLNWMRKQVEIHFGEMAIALGSQGVADVSSSAFHLLNSDRSDEDLQNDLFDLLGFDRFELTQLLLKHRRKIVKAPNPLSAGVSKQLHQMISAQMKSGPNMGIGVRVQSEQEKRLIKLMRKEEKKSSKVTPDLSGPKMNFDPQFLREQREIALVTALSAPLFSKKSSAAFSKVVYPNVYDSYLDAKHLPGFIAGVKMMLPLGFERNDSQKYEEISIPPTTSKVSNVPPKLVEISSLDEVGQLAFAGTERLNRIQSVVFETAYQTNENLLICAPTGAGKTNVAMLCIVREIRQNIEEGKLMLDKFKIVYIAPMKALAAEMVRNFGKKLEPLNVKVRELTGDMQLTKSEIKETQILVTTPEKWDVVTRKSTGDSSLALLVKLIIIDEVHLLHGDRGPVLESLVARTLRQVEASQSMIRIVGLSATLPNYVDVATFLKVNPFIGLFYFDGRFRPVPLEQSFVGIKSLGMMQQMQDMDVVCYEKVLKMVQQKHQVMVFVHARNATVRTATILRDMANSRGDSSAFSAEQIRNYGLLFKQVLQSRNKQLRELFPYGFAFHHAGMLRQDRNLVERLFTEGVIRVLVCTATLAWGVNLPAHAVIIKGTELYDAKHGSYVDLGILDVMQIFGRAGRPQFDKSGHGTIITTHDKLAHYLSLLTCQYPIESQLIQHLEDNLNAEVALGTVTTIDEAVTWLSYTYLFVRMRKNPQVYGIKYDTLCDDPMLVVERRDLIVKTAKVLNAACMIRFDERTGYLYSTDLGRTASHFYIKHTTVETFNEMLKPMMTESDILSMISLAQEFDQVKVRDDELDELDRHKSEACEVGPVLGGSENPHGKINILIQAHISRSHVDCFSLVSDQAYIVQNASRILRALFEVVLRKSWSLMAGRLLILSKVLEQRLWEFESPLRQFRNLSFEVLEKLEQRNLWLERLRDMDASEIGHMIHHPKMGETVKRCVDEFPNLAMEATIQPITRTVLRVHLVVNPDFRWNDHVHGRNAESFWIWVEDPETNHMYHYEYFIISKKQVVRKETQTLVFTIPITEPLPSQYLVRAESDRWLCSQSVCAISFKHLILPERHPPNTDLLDLRPLPVSALHDVKYELLYNFTHFNPIQTQIFYTLYHTDHNVLLGAPTGSGKTIVAEIAMFRVFREYPNMKVVYIAPLKALVRERIDDWKVRLEQKLGKNVVELTGDVTPDVRAIESADVIVTTPEKWDGISRSWQTRNYVKSVSLIVIDEIHLLGEGRGPVLEVIVSRTNFISSHTGRNLRIIGLSTALANARDLADWLGIKEVGLYNFRPSVRPVPMEVHIQGFPGKYYCPRMATMNKPVYQGIRIHSPSKPSLVFVSSRRQTRLTALDLIAFLAAEDNPKQWLHIPEDEMDAIITGIKDSNLKLMLSFGIAIHHAGLQEKDRKLVEKLFVEGKIQVLIATATLAWGVNFPAHLVVVKGTEFYDGKTRRYVDFPITDVLQMVGRAGRPQFDDHGVAIVLVQDVKKHFYKKFLYEPFPVESSLLEVLPEHINAEVVAGTISSKQDAVDYLTWTYFFRRLLQNPSYYNLEDITNEGMNTFLSTIIEKSLHLLYDADCVALGEDERTLTPTTIGRIAAFYYLSYRTVYSFKEKLGPNTNLEQLLEILCSASEYDELPVRHNEDAINSDLAKCCPIPVNPYTYDSPHTKAHLLFQAYFGRLQLPCSDYLTDLKSVLDQSIRILQAMVDMSADQGWLSTTLLTINLIQMVVQARWTTDNSISILPHVEPQYAVCFNNTTKDFWGRIERPVTCLPELIDFCRGDYETFAKRIRDSIEERQIEEAFRVLVKLPIIKVSMSISGFWDGGNGTGENKPLNIGQISGKRSESSYIKVHADQEYVLRVNLDRLNRLKRHESQAHASKFPKGKDEGWILVLGDVEKREVVALKRLSFVFGSSNCQLVFYTPETVGYVVYTLYLMSDSYLGLDQQYDICLEVVSVSKETTRAEN